MAQPWLLLDTSCQHGVVAIWQQGQLRAQTSLPQRRQHAEMLPQGVQQCLQQSGIAFHELAGVAVGQGPGSFMGVRVAMAYAKGVACALGIGLVGLPTLLTLAAHDVRAAQRALILLDARRCQVFAQQVRYVTVPGVDAAVPIAHNNPAALNQEQMLQQAQEFDCIVACCLQQPWLDALGNKQIMQTHGPTALGMGRLLAAHLQQTGMPSAHSCSELQPTYVRSADARLPTTGAV
ncbi:MAG: tRNA (adenosine(37)-N6)-threonylcarbamoyltransferase complex dimerization subunit type 1 TsaB [Myxococcota bacterium]